MKYFVLALALFVATSATAQESEQQPAQTKSRKPTKERPAVPEGAEAGRSLRASRNSLATSYADSTEFNKAFVELYAIIKPKVTIQERTEKIFKAMTRSFARTGVDSAKAYEAVMQTVKPTLDHELIYATYRSQLTAEELKGWVAFLKTPAGKKILEVGDKLLAADDKQIESQVRRSVNTAIAPLRQPKTPRTQGENVRRPGAGIENGSGEAAPESRETESPTEEKK
jgi:hypothetical protein